VNRDGRRDLVCHFTTGLTGLLPGDTAAVLKARTISDLAIQGTDAVVLR